MNGLQRNRVTGGILLLVAMLWTAAVYWTIPGGSDGGQIGPRGFPLAMGILLAALSLIMLLSNAAANETAEERAPERTPRERFAEIWALVATFGFLGVYVLLLDWFGFLIATTVSTAGLLVLALNKRSPFLIAAISLGLAFGIWLILGKAMGVYLPRGSIIDWF